MKIFTIQADHIKRLNSVRLDLQGGHLIVAGRPDAGKTTALDLVWIAFKARAIGPEVISHGEDEARIQVTIGTPERTYTITRRLKRDGEPAGKLTIKSSDGGTYGAKFLEELISDLTFEPTEFARAEGKKQVDLLLKVVCLPDGVSLESLDADRAKAYAARTDANRDLERARAKLPATPPESVEEVKVAEVLQAIEAELEAAKATNTRNKEKRDLLARYKAEEAARAISVEKLAEQIRQLEAKMVELVNQGALLNSRIKEGEPIVAALVDVETAPIIARRATAIEEAEMINAKAREFQTYQKTLQEVENLSKVPQVRTAEIEAIDAKKKDLLDSVVWPVPGLSIRDGLVTYNDTILSQCGTSVRMRVSCAIAMAMNPKLNTIRIDEGESLGQVGRDEVLRWADEKGFQVLMSIVKDGPAEAGELEITEDGSLLSIQPAVVDAPEVERTLATAQ